MRGDRLKTLRIENNLSQEKLATILGVHRTMIGKYESKNLTPARNILDKMVEFFNVSHSYLYGFDEKIEPKPVRTDEYKFNENIIGHNLRMYREKAGYSQKDLASIVGTAKSTMSQYESGERNISDANKVKIVKALNITVDMLFDETTFNEEIPEITTSENVTNNFVQQNLLGNYIRKKRGFLSLREFAAKCDCISHTQIDTIERGIDPRTGKPVRPTVDTLARIAKGANVSPIFLAQLALDKQPVIDLVELFQRDEVRLNNRILTPEEKLKALVILKAVFD